MDNTKKNISEWYRSKVDRIGRIDGVFIEKLAARSVTLFIQSDELKYYSNQVMVITSTILLSNWCNNIQIVLGKDHACIVPGFENRSMKSIIEELITLNDDEISFQFNDGLLVDTDAYLSVGPLTIDNPNVVWMSADGWVSGYGRTSKTYQKITKTNDLNPIGSVFSACLAHSVIFKIILGIEEEIEFSKWFSLYDHTRNSAAVSLANPRIPSNVDLGRIIQVGCGAVGSSFDFILSLTKCSGVIELLDFDKVEPPNLISSLLFQKQNALTGDKKVDACFNILENSHCKPKAFVGDFSEFIKSAGISENYPDLVLCFANEHNVWSTIQNNYPPIVLHATTTPNWGINFGRHIPLKEWCIVCRFGIENSNTVPVCAESVIEASQLEKKQPMGVLPFLSPASAVIIFAELIKLNINKMPAVKNFTEFGMRSTQHSNFRSLQMPKKEDCPVCSKQYKEVYDLYLNKSKYNS